MLRKRLFLDSEAKEREDKVLQRVAEYPGGVIQYWYPGCILDIHVRKTGEMKDKKDKRYIMHGLHSMFGRTILLASETFVPHDND